MRTRSCKPLHAKFRASYDVPEELRCRCPDCFARPGSRFPPRSFAVVRWPSIITVPSGVVVTLTPGVMPVGAVSNTADAPVVVRNR